MTAKTSTTKKAPGSPGGRPNGVKGPRRRIPKTPRPTPEQEYARHLASRRDGPVWYHTLGRLALACCPPGERGRPRRLADLVAAHPGVSKNNLYKAMRFATLYTPAAAVRLAGWGLGWDMVVQLLAVKPLDRPRAEKAMRRKLERTKMTSREVRLWRTDRFGARSGRGGRRPVPISGYRPSVQARALATDCRRLAHRHALTGQILGRALAAGRVPSPAEVAEYRAAAEAAETLLDVVGAARSDLERILAACEGVSL